MWRWLMTSPSSHMVASVTEVVLTSGWMEHDSVQRAAQPPSAFNRTMRGISAWMQIPGAGALGRLIESVLERLRPDANGLKQRVVSGISRHAVPLAIDLSDRSDKPMADDDQRSTNAAPRLITERSDDDLQCVKRFDRRRVANFDTSKLVVVNSTRLIRKSVRLLGVPCAVGAALEFDDRTATRRGCFAP